MLPHNRSRAHTLPALAPAPRLAVPTESAAPRAAHTRRQCARRLHSPSMSACAADERLRITTTHCPTMRRRPTPRGRAQPLHSPSSAAASSNLSSGVNGAAWPTHSLTHTHTHTHRSRQKERPARGTPHTRPPLPSPTLARPPTLPLLPCCALGKSKTRQMGDVMLSTNGCFAVKSRDPDRPVYARPVCAFAHTVVSVAWVFPHADAVHPITRRGRIGAYARRSTRQRTDRASACGDASSGDEHWQNNWLLPCWCF
jgi:hypothetical protein